MNSTYNGYKFFKKPARFDEDHLMVSDGLGYECSKNFLIDRDYFFNSLVMYVISGKLYVEQAGRKYPLTKDQGILMKLTDKHKYYTDKNDTAHVLWFHFRGKACDYFLDKLTGAACLPLVFQSDTIENNIYRLFDATMQRQFGYELDVSSMIYSMIIGIVKNKLEEIQQQSLSLRDLFINSVNTYIDSNIYQHITLEEFSKKMNMSKYHFCRIFRIHLNTTPIKYILYKRIELSKNLLIYTNDKIETIASKLGFTDISHFSKVFKGIVGVNPSIFRRN